MRSWRWTSAAATGMARDDSIRELHAFLKELDLVAIRIGDVDGQAIDAIVQLIEELDLRGFEAPSDATHVADAKGHVIDLQRPAGSPHRERDALGERHDRAAVRQRDCPPGREAQ